MKLIHAIVLAPLLLSAPSIAGEPVNIGSRLELMIDDHLIDTMSGGVRLQLHKPVRRNVALVTDEPWEGNACSYCSVFQDGDRYRMYFGSQNYVNTKGKLVNTHEPTRGGDQSVPGHAIESELAPQHVLIDVGRGDTGGLVALAASATVFLGASVGDLDDLTLHRVTVE